MPVQIQAPNKRFGGVGAGDTKDWVSYLSFLSFHNLCKVPLIKAWLDHRKGTELVSENTCSVSNTNPGQIKLAISYI